MDRIIKIVLSGFLICAVIMPLKNIDWNFEFSLEDGHINADVSDAENIVEEQTLTLARHKIEMLALQVLEKKSVIPQKIEVFTDKESVTSISIITIEVTVGAECLGREKEIKDILEKELAVDVTVINAERT